MSRTQKSPRIAIIGSGAIGCYYGGRLAQHGNDVHFLMRSDYDVVNRDGLKIRSHLGDFDLPQVNCQRSTAEIGACDLVIIAMKATANDVLHELLPPLLKDDTMILTLQNGLGSDDFLAQYFGSKRVLGGLCFVCINRSRSRGDSSHRAGTDRALRAQRGSANAHSGAGGGV